MEKRGGLEPPLGFTELMFSDEPEYNWLIDGLLEYGDRVIITGGEGKGKSTLLRQIGLMLACGLHPFTREKIERRRVLYLDLENSRFQAKRGLSSMVANIPEDMKPDIDSWYQMANWVSGIDLTLDSQANEVSHYIYEYKPELVICGPMYKMAPDLRDEDTSKKLSERWDRWRGTVGFALMMESHQPHSSVVKDDKGGSHQWRPERPYGSSLWLRWPEFGYCLETGGVLREWRGPRDRTRDWPEKMYQGRTWPWETGGMAECLHCGIPLEGKQQRFCTDAHASAFRQAQFRARSKVDAKGVIDSTRLN